MIKRITVFCGSNAGADPELMASAERLGRALAERGLTVVYGGAHVGLMGGVADAALAAGGKVIGVLPELLADRELAHTGLTEMHVVSSMHERKALMAELGDGFIALPGGAGTLDEFFEVFTWAQLGMHQKPLGILNVKGYYDHLIALVQHMVEMRFLSAVHSGMLLVDTEAHVLLDRFTTYVAPEVTKWLDKSRT